MFINEFLLIMSISGVLTFAFFFLTVINAYVANIYTDTLSRRFLKRPPTAFRDPHQFQASTVKPHHLNGTDGVTLDIGSDLEAK